jgi:hypothetical protein
MDVIQILDGSVSQGQDPPNTPRKKKRGRKALYKAAKAIK